MIARAGQCPATGGAILGRIEPEPETYPERLKALSRSQYDQPGEPLRLVAGSG
jgi:hypothetical protein